MKFELEISTGLPCSCADFTINGKKINFKLFGKIKYNSVGRGRCENIHFKSYRIGHIKQNIFNTELRDLTPEKILEICYFLEDNYKQDSCGMCS